MTRRRSPWRTWMVGPGTVPLYVHACVLIPGAISHGLISAIRWIVLILPASGGGSAGNNAALFCASDSARATMSGATSMATRPGRASSSVAPSARDPSAKTSALMRRTARNMVLLLAFGRGLLLWVADEDVARQLRADGVLLAGDDDRQQSHRVLAVLDADRRAGAQADLRQKLEQFGNVVLDLEHRGRHAQRQVRELDRAVVAPDRAILARNRVTVRAGRRFAREARQMTLDERRYGVFETARLGGRDLPRNTEMIHQQAL